MFDFSVKSEPRVYHDGEVRDIEPGGPVFEVIERLARISAIQAPPDVCIEKDNPLDEDDINFWRVGEWMSLRKAGSFSGHYVGEADLSPHDADSRVVHEALCPQVYFYRDAMIRLVDQTGVRPVSLFAQRRPSVVLEWMRGVANGDDSYAGLDRLLEMHPDMFFLLDACRCSEVCLEYAKGSPVLLSLLAMALLWEHGLHSRVRDSSILTCLYALSWIAGPGLGPLRAAYNTGYALRRARDVCDTDPPSPELRPFHEKVWGLYHSSYGQVCLRLHYLATTILGSVAVAMDPRAYYQDALQAQLCKRYIAALDAKLVSVRVDMQRRHNIDMGRYRSPRPNCCPVDGWWVGDTSIPETIHAQAMTYRVGFLGEGPDGGVLGEFWRSDEVRQLCHAFEIHERRRLALQAISLAQTGRA